MLICKYCITRYSVDECVCAEDRLCSILMFATVCLCPSGCEWQAYGRLCGVSWQWRSWGRNRERRQWEKLLVVQYLDFMVLILEQLFNANLCNLPKLPDSDPQKKVARIRHETQIHILNLLITSLALKAPNLALYLLGYDVKKPVSSTNLQDPGQTTAVIVVYLVKWNNIKVGDETVDLGNLCLNDHERVCHRCVGMSKELLACHPKSAAKRHWEEIRTCPHTAGPTPGRALLPGAL